MSVPVYQGTFGPAQAERLLWRAGTGPRPGEATTLAARGLRGAVRSLTRPKGAAKYTGPEPHADGGRKLHPRDVFADAHLWWLDRMVRTNHPMTERMTLVWHDWFATSEVGVGSRFSIEQYGTLRRNALGNFGKMVRELTKDPAMLIWLSGIENHKGAPNENFARELMELFTLGAGRGYTERDVRQQARALSGFGWKHGKRTTFYPRRHDAGVKTIFGKKGRFSWQDAGRLCLQNSKHPSFFVTKLWSYFIPTPPDASTQAGLEAIYRKHHHDIRPVVEAILMHPALYEGQRMVKPPVIQIAGMLRHLGTGVVTDDWSWLSAGAGQQLFVPPDVSGWDDSRWLDTSTWRGRWLAADNAIKARAVTGVSETADQAVTNAIAFWGNPTVTTTTRDVLLAFAKRTGGADRQNALRMLIANSPDLQTS